MDLVLENYKNILTIQGFDPEAVIKSCVDLEYEKDRRSNVEVEDKMQWPQFVRAFSAFVVSNNSVPSQSDFFYYYIGVNYRFFLPLKIDNHIYTALKARLS